MKRCHVSFVSLLMFVSFQISASTFIKMSDERLLNKAEQVISGKVLEITYQLENNMPYHYVEILVDKAYKNNEEDLLEPGEKVFIRQIGGKVGDIQFSAQGLAKFVEGSDVLVLLNFDRNKEFYYVVGGEQGKFDIVDNDTLIRDSVDSMFVNYGEDGKVRLSSGEIEEISQKQLLQKLNKS